MQHCDSKSASGSKMSSMFVFAGQRNKKWKSLYFVLNASEQQLYYFDNQKVTDRVASG